MCLVILEETFQSYDLFIQNFLKCLIILEEKFLFYDLIIQNPYKVSGNFGRETPIS